jgi:hypothetical protein
MDERSGGISRMVSNPKAFRGKAENPPQTGLESVELNVLTQKFLQLLRNLRLVSGRQHGKGLREHKQGPGKDYECDNTMPVAYRH